MGLDLIYARGTKLRDEPLEYYKLETMRKSSEMRSFAVSGKSTNSPEGDLIGFPPSATQTMERFVKSSILTQESSLAPICHGGQ
jgi:hypothetical protein